MIREILAKSVLRKEHKTDSWFLSRYRMNLYRGCSHNCTYCDGRSEKYQVWGDFGSDVDVKINAADILKNELRPGRYGTPLKKGFIMVGGGVGDAYQPAEEKYRLTRKTLELILEHDLPVHILTKSVLVERDMDILADINRKSKVIISMSFSSVDEKVSRTFEPGVPSPGRRMETIKKFKKQGHTCGIFLMPVIPFITDAPDKMDPVFREAKSAGADFIVFSGMTLKEGRQKGYFMNTLGKYDPSLIPKYLSLYKGDKWGGARWDYYESIHRDFYSLAEKYKIPIRIPLNPLRNYIDEDERIIAMLEQMEYLLKFRGIQNRHRQTADFLSNLKAPIRTCLERTDKENEFEGILSGVVNEIINTGRCEEYERLMNMQH